GGSRSPRGAAPRRPARAEDWSCRRRCARQVRPCRRRARRRTHRRGWCARRLPRRRRVRSARLHLRGCTRMNPAVDADIRTALLELTQSEGEGFYRDPTRVESRLRERAPDHPAEVAALVTAVRAGVVDELLGVKPGLFEVAVGHLSGRMVRMYDSDPDAARWAVESWAQALGAGHEPKSSVLAVESRPTAEYPPPERREAGPRFAI